MFSERTHQIQIIGEDLQHEDQRHNVVKPDQRTMKTLVLKEKAKSYLKLFLNTSSIHGLNHVVAPRRQIMEISLWLSIIFLSAFGSLFLSSLTWSRYQSSPTVVSMDRDMFAWNTTFPCVTICPNSIRNIDAEKLEVYLKNSDENNKTRLKNFIIGLANATYRSFEYVPEYPDIHPDDYVQLIVNLSQAFKPTLTIGVSNVVLNMVPTITEMGLCYSVNSRIAEYNSLEYRKANRWDRITNEKKSLFVHPLDGEVFAQVIDMSTPYNVFIHGPTEVPDITSKSQQSDEGFYMKLYVTALTVYTSKEASTLSVSQRRCRFIHENNLKHNSIYTYTMCRMECRIKLSLKYCQCIPHFYRKLDFENYCDVKGLHCLANHTDMLYTLRHKDGTRINCGCLPLCDDVNYILQANTLQEWFLGTNLQWGLVTYPRLRYRRDIIFGFTDVLVAVGGMAGLFLGCSVLSFMEIVYFLTLRLMCYTNGHRSSK